jgi:acyl-coenzyme A thioesterase PaaI-like protein
MPLALKLGSTLRAVQPDHVIMEMTLVVEEHANLLGVVHGVVSMALADTAMDRKTGDVVKSSKRSYK